MNIFYSDMNSSIWPHNLAYFLIWSAFVHYLIRKESQLVEEVLCQFYFVFHIAFLYLGSHILCLLAHVFLKKNIQQALATDINIGHQNQILTVVTINMY